MVMAHARSAHLEVASDSSVPEVILPIQYFDRLTVRATDGAKDIRPRFPRIGRRRVQGRVTRRADTEDLTLDAMASHL